MSGYNLFIGRFVRATREGTAPELLVPLWYETWDGSPVPDGARLVRRRDTVLFFDELADGRGEIALTPSDGRYTFVLTRRSREDAVATTEDIPEADVPHVLDSGALGIHLVLSSAIPSGH